jgi:hypothetical protein
VIIHLDAEVIARFKETAPQYQTAANKVLREYGSIWSGMRRVSYSHSTGERGRMRKFDSDANP